MRIRIRNELLPLSLLVIVLIAAITFFPSNILRIILGLPLVLFFPGYALMAALFPSREGVGSIERVALSFGLSIAVVPLLLLILNYTPWGIGLESILYSIVSFILIASVSAWFRRKRLPKEKRFGVEFNIALPGWGTGIQDKVLSIILVLAILGALGMMGYAIATPGMGQEFTEFYILGQETNGGRYPKQLVVGEEGKMVMGITHHEYRTVSYLVEVRIDGIVNNKIQPILLQHGEKWEEEVVFTPYKVGDNQKVEFLLYRNGEAKPYLEPLRLWVDVTE